jgi:hypothetical protein
MNERHNNTYSLLKVKKSPKPRTFNNKMNFSNVNQNAKNFSIYIPRVPTGYNVPLLEHIFNRDVGAVERVDLMPCENAKWADRANPSRRFNKAFIHLKYYYNYDLSNLIINAFTHDAAYYWHTQPREYFILLKNRNPVPSTILNIHQVVDNCRLMEDQLSSSKQEIAELKTMVADLEEKNDRMIQELVQVFGVLHNNGILKQSAYGKYNYMKYGKFIDTRYLILPDDDGTDEYLHTHSQKWMYSEYAEPQEEEDDDSKLSLSTSSSMPSLIEDYDDEIPRGKKMTIDELSSSSTSSASGSVSAIPVVERIRNSAELCGNN